MTSAMPVQCSNGILGVGHTAGSKYIILYVHVHMVKIT